MRHILKHCLKDGLTKVVWFDEFFLIHTCFMFNRDGKAVAPALTATVKGDSMDNPIRAQASLTNISE